VSAVRSSAVAALLAVVVLALAACGVGSQPDATPIDREAVPFGLLEPASTTTSVPAGRTTSVYLVSGDRLLRVDRSIPAAASPADLVELVVAGPSEVERAFGVTTALPAGSVARVGASRGAAEVELSSGFSEVRGDEQLLALAQIVYTLTEQPGIGGVRFTLGDEPIRIPTEDGVRGDGFLSRDDLSALGPR
jgi:spore germination protein GerM